MFTFIELQGFSKRRQALLPDDEFRAFQEILINDPEAGDTISGTGGFRKIRWSRPGTGKPRQRGESLRNTNKESIRITDVPRNFLSILCEISHYQQHSCQEQTDARNN